MSAARSVAALDDVHGNVRALEGGAGRRQPALFAPAGVSGGRSSELDRHNR
jgi:hypothetical protein